MSFATGQEQWTYGGGGVCKFLPLTYLAVDLAVVLVHQAPEDVAREWPLERFAVTAGERQVGGRLRLDDDFGYQSNECKNTS